MFSVSQDGDFIVLKSGTSAVGIWPRSGGILNNWQVAVGGKTWDIIDGYESPEDFKENCEAKGFRSCKLSPYVCRMDHSKYTFDGQQYTIGKFELAGNVIHGLLYDLPFEVVESHADGHSASLLLRHVYEASDAGYPFAYTLEVRYLLEADNRLTIVTVAENRHHQPIPFSDGWHPYFSLGKPVDELEFVMDASTIVEFNASLIPTGKLLPYDNFQEPALVGSTELDNCFVLNDSQQSAACRLVNREDNLQLTITANHGYPYLQVYTPPHRKSIAVENLSSVPDAFNNHIGLMLLAPGEKASFSCTYAVGEVG